MLTPMQARMLVIIAGPRDSLRPPETETHQEALVRLIDAGLIATDGDGGWSLTEGGRALANSMDREYLIALMCGPEYEGPAAEIGGSADEA